MPGGSDLGSISSADPSQHPDQEETRARPGVWSVYDWRRKYGVVWCEKYGGTAIGGDSEADRKLGAQLNALPVEGLVAAQARAPEMFREFLAVGGEAAEARHRWSWFVGRWESLRVPAQRRASGRAQQNMDVAGELLAKEGAR